LSGSHRRPPAFPSWEGRTPFCAPGSMTDLDCRGDEDSRSNLPEGRLGGHIDASLGPGCGISARRPALAFERADDFLIRLNRATTVAHHRAARSSAERVPERRLRGFRGTSATPKAYFQPLRRGDFKLFTVRSW
jgi:hypothetical protein